MLPAEGELLHFSEDPTITRFVPHVAATAQQPEAYVWALGAERSPCYWFPRQCPRGTAWAGPRTSGADRDRILGPGSDRVHAVEYRWLDRLRTTRLYAYRFAAADFRPFPFDSDHPHAWVATEAVEPLGPAEPLGDLLGLHEAAGIELRVLADLGPFWAAVATSTLEFSGIRLRNAGPPILPPGDPGLDVVPPPPSPAPDDAGREPRAPVRSRAGRRARWPRCRGGGGGRGRSASRPYRPRRTRPRSARRARSAPIPRGPRRGPG